MLFIFIQFNLFRQIIEIAVHHNPDITAPLCLLKDFRMFALASADHRRQELNPCPLRQCQNSVHHLVYRLLLNDLAAFRTMGNTDSGIKQTQIVINLRDCSNRGTGIPVC